MRIVIYDSGVGGLSIYQAVWAVLPSVQYVFLSDNEAFPYGTKSANELLHRVHQVSASIIKHYSPDIIIVACNTASTLALESLRSRFATRFIGVVPAIKPAALITKTQHIAVLATPATVARDYTHQLIADFAQGCKVDLLAAPTMVRMAEAKLRGESVDLQELATILNPIKADPTIDTIVLACTHFPLLRPEIEQVLGDETTVRTIVDSAAAIARRTCAVVDELRSCSPDQSLGRLTQTHTEQSGPNVAAFTRADAWSHEFLANLKAMHLEIVDTLVV